jgi:hypothetical protein
MPYWLVVIIILVLVVGYYLLTQQARERRRDRIGGDFGKIPNFYPNQSYADVAGDTAVGIDDRGRRIAVARRHAQPRTRVYSFAHLVSAEVLQNERLVASITPAGREVGGAPAGGDATTGGAATGEAATGAGAAGRAQAGAPAGERAGEAYSGLFGSTQSAKNTGVTGLPILHPAAGQVTRVALRMRFRNGDASDEVTLRFYEGKPVNSDGMEAERAFAEAQVLLGSLDIAMKRAGSPPRGPAIPRTPVR